MSADIDWLERDRHVIKGLDHLGLQVVSVSLYGLLLPGITNVTDRARYYSFYPWVLHRYAQGSSKKGGVDWVTWFRRLDFAYCMASVAHEMATDTFDARATAVVGADTARRLLRDANEKSKIDVRSAADLDAAGKVPKKDAYFQNKEGGLGQYYKGSLRDLGLVGADSAHRFPDVQLTNYAGVPVADSLEENAAFKELLDLAEGGSGRFSELASVGARIAPSGIRRKSREESLLRSLLVGVDDGLCRGQTPRSRAWRRALIRLVLSYTRESEFVEGAFDYEFRWACLAGALPDGRPWKLPEELRTVASAWGAYQRNDLMNYALECLFWVALNRLDERPTAPRQVADYIADIGCEAIPARDDIPGLPAIDGTVAHWVETCRQEASRRKAAAWDEASTWTWAENLTQALNAEDDAGVAAWAIRVLGRLVSDRGRFDNHPFEHVPNALEMAAVREVQLQTWLQRVKDRSSEPVRNFVAELVIEWVVFRHLRVATRKLAAQGVSTFKLRPERGRLVIAAEDIPHPTYTNPRVRQAHRILADLHLLEVEKDGTRISTDGEKLLESVS